MWKMAITISNKPKLMSSRGCCVWPTLKSPKLFSLQHIFAWKITWTINRKSSATQCICSTKVFVYKLLNNRWILGLKYLPYSLILYVLSTEIIQTGTKDCNVCFQVICSPFNISHVMITSPCYLVWLCVSAFLSPAGLPDKWARLWERGDDEDEAGCWATETHRTNAKRRWRGRRQVIAQQEPAQYQPAIVK